MFKILKSPLVKNSIWGISSNILQKLFLGVFFAIIARRYDTTKFAQFLISNTIYLLVAAFSSMGLGQWFIREYSTIEDKLTLTRQFLKTQIGLGLLFYVANIFLAFAIYQDHQIRLLCIILGTNIIFDNLINAIRSLNIAESQQNKTAVILSIDGFLKLLVGCLLFISPFSMVTLCCLMILTRLLTLSLFLKVGSSDSISLGLLWKVKISITELKKLIWKNWYFIVIGSISIIYWSIDNIIISKTLGLGNVADYEISFRIFSLFLILPVIASATVFPRFVKYVNEKDFSGLKKFYKNVFIIYTLFSLISYAFIYSFSGLIINTIVGTGYPGAIICLKQMFLTFLILPTTLLQANLIVAMGLEKLDMWFNIISLIVNVTGCLVGLYFVEALSVINYSILLSILIFHVLQDILLIRKNYAGLIDLLLFYTAIFLFREFYVFMSLHINHYINFISFTAILICIVMLVYKMQSKSLSA